MARYPAFPGTVLCCYQGSHCLKCSSKSVGCVHVFVRVRLQLRSNEEAVTSTTGVRKGG